MGTSLSSKVVKEQEELVDREALPLAKSRLLREAKRLMEGKLGQVPGKCTM
jgi:hypothetical protein